MPFDDPLTDPLDPETIFTCQKCGTCCLGYGGAFVTREQIEAIAEYIGMDIDRFIRKKCTYSGGKPLLGQHEDGTCIFWDEICTIYPVRPDMCRKWPFIESVLHDVSNWHIMAGSCPGMRTDVSDEVIRNCVKRALSKKQ